MKSSHLIVTALAAVAAVSPACAQKRDAGALYLQLCAQCHGRDLQGSEGAPSMLDDVWKHGGDDATMARVIREGVADTQMPSFRDGLTPAEIRSLIVYIHEQRAKVKTQGLPEAPKIGSDSIASELHAFRLEVITEDVKTPWSIAWLPDGRALVTEKPGGVRIIDQGKLGEPLKGTPEVNTNSQGGMLEVAVHPDYAKNGWIYLAFSHETRNGQGDAVSMTKLVRGRIKDNTWVDEQSIWTAPLETYLSAGGVHYGCRIAFDGKGYLFFSHGERGRQEQAQDLKRPNGKIHRIHDDGRIPADNPFVNEPGAVPSIWTYGNRNPQGMDIDPRTGGLWAAEHGPRGGDELNIIRKGRNYGWPVITYGINYNGTPITAETAREGMEQPVTYWTPSIAVCGIDFYAGELFPQWKGSLLVGALAKEELRRLVIEDDKVTHQEVLLRNLGRIRDVATGPDGAVYILFNSPDRVVRMVPAKPAI